MRATYGCLYFPCCSIVRLRLIPAATSQPDPYSYDRRPASTPPSGLTPCPLLPRRQGWPSNAKCREDEPSPLSANGATTILPFIPSRHAMPPSPFSSIARSPARRSLSHRLLEAKAGVVSSPRTRKACLHSESLFAPSHWPVRHSSLPSHGGVPGKHDRGTGAAQCLVGVAVTPRGLGARPAATPLCPPDGWRRHASARCTTARATL